MTKLTESLQGKESELESCKTLCQSLRQSLDEQVLSKSNVSHPVPASPRLVIAMKDSQNSSSDHDKAALQVK